MTYYGIEFDGTGHRVYATEDGIAKRLLGPRWASPRQAMAYAELQASLDDLSGPEMDGRVDRVPPRPAEDIRPSISRPDAAATSRRSRGTLG